MNTLKVFVSGTIDDMQHERDAVSHAIDAVALATGIRAEKTLSQSIPPRKWIQEQIRACNIYLGVYSHRYGWVLPEENISATEFEFNEAHRRKKPILVWVRKLQAEEKALPGLERQQEFLARVSSFSDGYLRQEFENPADLEKWVSDALRETFIEIIQNVTTQNNRQSAQVLILLEGDFDEFKESKDKQEAFLDMLSGVLHIEHQQVRLVHIEEGSIRLTIDLPHDAALRLIDLYVRADPIIKQLSITEVRSISDLKTSASPRTFRKSKWRHILRPATTSSLLSLFFAVFAILAFFYGAHPVIVGALWLATGVNFLYLLRLIERWSVWRVIARQGSSELLLREGLFRHKETHIPLTPFTTVTVEQDWLGEGLDIGTATIDAMGGPFVLKDIEDFRDFQQVVRSLTKGGYLHRLPHSNSTSLRLFRSLKERDLSIKEQEFIYLVRRIENEGRKNRLLELYIELLRKSGEALLGKDDEALREQTYKTFLDWEKGTEEEKLTEKP